jgi:hypothetical protein
VGDPAIRRAAVCRWGGVPQSWGESHRSCISPSSASLTTPGRTISSRRSAAHCCLWRKRRTESSSPVTKRAGCSTHRPAVCAVSSQLRSMFRYQLSLCGHISAQAPETHGREPPVGLHRLWAHLARSRLRLRVVLRRAKRYACACNAPRLPHPRNGDRNHEHRGMARMASHVTATSCFAESQRPGAENRCSGQRSLTRRCLVTVSMTKMSPVSW